MNTNPQDQDSNGQELPPPEINENRLLNTDTGEQPRRRTAPLRALNNNASYPPPSEVTYAEPQPGEYLRPQPRKRRRRWPWVVGCLIVLLVLLAVLGLGVVGLGYVFHLGPSTTTTRHFTVGTHPTIVINNDVGTILVHTGGIASVVTIAETRSGTLFGGSPNNVQVSYAQSNGGNIISVNVNRPGGSSFFNSSSVDFDVSAPNTADLQLKTSTGSVNVNGISGQMSLSSNTGSVSATQVNLTGSSTLKTNTGSVDFSGTIGTTGTYQFESNTGSVNVTLPRSASFHLNAKTDTGSFNTDFPGIHVQHNTVGSSASSDVGTSPGASLILTTNTGSINLNTGS